jgi:hypothetical protein
MNIHAAGHSQNGLCQFVRLKIARTAPDYGVTYQETVAQGVQSLRGTDGDSEWFDAAIRDKQAACFEIGNAASQKRDTLLTSAFQARRQFSGRLAFRAAGMSRACSK